MTCTKLRSYRRNGVREYVVWLVEDRAFRWYELQDGQFVAQTADADSMLNSKVFPGLRLAVASLLSGDMATVLAELQEALKTDIHKSLQRR
ncbi:MAG: Uma2 family endonuclease [Cyanobacteria bacterium P01_C01_bin.70]